MIRGACCVKIYFNLTSSHNVAMVMYLPCVMDTEKSHGSIRNIVSRNFGRHRDNNDILVMN